MYIRERHREQRRRAAVGFLVVLALLAATHARASGQVVAVLEVDVHSATGGPVPGAAVTPIGGETVHTGPSGRATLRGLAPGGVTLSVTALGYVAETVEALAVNGRTTRVAVMLAPAPLDVEGLEVGVASGDLPPGGVELLVERLPSTVRDLAEALDRVPGVTVVREGGAGTAARVQIRGAASDQVLVLLDGVPLNSPLTGEVDLGTVDLSSLERVVVAPGARSSRYGARALGGVVLLERRGHAGTWAQTSAGVGAWAERRLSAALGWAGTGPWTLAADGHWSRARGDFDYEVPVFRGGGRAPRENAAHRRMGGSVRLAHRTERTTTSLRVHVSDVTRGSPGSIAQPSATGDQSHTRRGAVLRADLGSTRAGGSILVGVQHQRSAYADSAPPFGPAYAHVARVTRSEAAVDGRRALGPVTFRGGVDAGRLDVRSSALTATSLELDEVGAWSSVQMDHAFTDASSATVRLEARMDRHDLVDETAASPAASLSLTHRGTRLSLALRSAFAPPGLDDLFFQEGVLVRANPDLRPERVRAERTVGLEQRFDVRGAQVELGLAAYDADVDDMILWFPDFRFVWSPDNFDVSRAGAEVSASVGVDALGASHALRAHAAWSRVEYRGEVLSGQVAYRPRRTADVAVTVGLPFGDATLQLDHVGERRSIAGSDLNTLPAYTTADVGFGARLELGGFDARVELSVSNLLDRPAALLVDYPLPGRGWSARLRLRTADHPRTLRSDPSQETPS